MRIHVCSLALAPSLIESERPSHVVSLLSPEEIHLAPSDHHASDRHLRLPMHDLREAASFPSDTPPSAAHVEELLAFGAGWSGEAPILVHCWAGISRSTAAAYAIACARNPSINEEEVALALRAASPTAWPNPVFIGFADAALGRSGRMVAAIEAIGMPDHFEAEPFHLPADFPAPKG
jgi:predicted protein tyrosine phosphatase